jgi:hypothetical protein
MHKNLQQKKISKSFSEQKNTRALLSRGTILSGQASSESIVDQVIPLQVVYVSSTHQCSILSEVGQVDQLNKTTYDTQSVSSGYSMLPCSSKVNHIDQLSETTYDAQSVSSGYSVLLCSSKVDKGRRLHRRYSSLSIVPISELSSFINYDLDLLPDDYVSTESFIYSNTHPASSSVNDHVNSRNSRSRINRIIGFIAQCFPREREEVIIENTSSLPLFSVNSNVNCANNLKTSSNRIIDFITQCFPRKREAGGTN